LKWAVALVELVALAVAERHLRRFAHHL